MHPPDAISTPPILEIPLAGRLDTDSVPEIADYLAGLELPVGGVLCLDLAGVKYMGSLGLRMVVERGKAMKSIGGVLRLRGLQPRVEKSLRATGLSRFFETEGETAEVCPTPPPAANGQSPDVVLEDPVPDALGTTTPPEPGVELVLEMPNVAACIQPTISRLRTFLEDNDASPDAVYVLEMAAEELLTNVVKYAFADDDEHLVIATASILAGQIRFTVEDDGKPFDPHNAPKPDLSLDIEDMPIGGLGLHLVQELADGTSYERAEDKNRTSVHIGLKGRSMAAYE